MAETDTPKEVMVVVELTDNGSVVTRKPVSVATTVTLKDLLKLAKNKLRKVYQYCLLYDVSELTYTRVETDKDLLFVLDRSKEQTKKPCFLFTNKLPQHVLKLDAAAISAEPAVCFIIGDEATTQSLAVNQLKNAASLPGVLAAIGMPDLHAGKGIPIGAAIITEAGTAYPQLVDSDIGCGMSFVETGITRGKLTTNKLRKVADRMDSIDTAYANVEEMKEMCQLPLCWASKDVEALPELPSDEHYMRMGTIGGGNHFAELQEFDQVMDAERIAQYGIDTDKVHLLVHSGSRSLGAEYIQNFCDQAATQPRRTMHHGHFAVDTESILFKEYLQNHDTALNFAVRNRELIAKRLLAQITQDDENDPTCSCKIDIHHNFLERIQLSRLDVLHQMEADQGLFPKRILPTASPQYQRFEEQRAWIHRKGATPTNQSPILVIPGSRGSLSYLVEVNSEAMHGSAYSLAHGAGRQMTRAKARSMNAERYHSQQQLLQTDMGGVVICDKKDLVYEEAPNAYKSIDGVVRSLAQDVCSEIGGLVRILATLRPILTYKYKDPYK